MYIVGLYLEGSNLIELFFYLWKKGARWNCETHALDEAIPKVIYEKMPIVWLIPD